MPWRRPNVDGVHEKFVIMFKQKSSDGMVTKIFPRHYTFPLLFSDQNLLKCTKHSWVTQNVSAHMAFATQ